MPRKKAEPALAEAVDRPAAIPSVFPNVAGTVPMTIQKAQAEFQQQSFRVEALSDDGSQLYIAVFGAMWLPYLLGACRVRAFDEVLGKRIAGKVVATNRLDKAMYVLAASFCEALPAPESVRVVESPVVVSTEGVDDDFPGFAVAD